MRPLLALLLASTACGTAAGPVPRGPSELSPSAAVRVVAGSPSPPPPAFDLPALYIYEGGQGTLEIAGSKVTIDTVGANAHTCQVEGVLTDDRVVVDEAPDCMIALKRGAATASIESTEACSAYCGVRARFDGTYRAPPPGCAPSDLDAASAHPTVSALERVLATCTKFADRFRIAELRGKLAESYRQDGRFAECLGALEPERDLASSTDRELRDGWPPADAESFIAIAKPLRATWAKCRKKQR